MTRTHFDFIIIGGGCSGLSLALSLSAKEKNKTVLIIESRPEYIEDRTWCFWNVQKHPFENLIEHRWKIWEVQSNGKKLSLESPNYEYQCISSKKFYEATTSQLQNCPHVIHLMNTKVIRMTEHSAEVFIETSQGEFNSPTVFDSGLAPQKANLLQHFHGWKISTKKGTFKPNAVTLMDFDVDQQAGLNFMYLLPYSDCCALIESTYISSQVLPKTDYECAIKKYLKERYSLEHYEILGKEEGVLPLRASLTKTGSKRIIPIGANAGWARASTGYAFLAIQEGVKNLLDSKYSTNKKWIDNFLDQIFLSYLEDESKKAPELFFNLFKKNRSDGLIRFLTSQWSYHDLLMVLLSMPKMAMIKKVLG